jgi:Domain of unknown function (DUF4129)
VKRWGRWLVPCAALAWSLALAGVAVAQTPIGPDEFADRLRRALELARIEGHAPSPERMGDLRDALGLPVEVAVGDWVVEISPDPILADLEGDHATDFELASERLATLEASLTDALARDPPGSDRVAAALSEAYRGVVPPQPDVAQLVLQWIGEVLEAILARIGNVIVDAGNALAWIVLAAIVVLAVLYLLRARLLPDRVSSAGRVGRAAIGPVDWAARADEALRAGDLREAVRALYLAMLATLAGRGIVADAPALTAGEARFAVQRRQPALLPAIARGIDSYERVVYGGATPDQGDVEHLREAAARARGQ